MCVVLDQVSSSVVADTDNRVVVEQVDTIGAVVRQLFQHVSRSH